MSADDSDPTDNSELGNLVKSDVKPEESVEPRLTGSLSASDVAKVVEGLRSGLSSAAARYFPNE